MNNQNTSPGIYCERCEITAETAVSWTPGHKAKYFSCQNFVLSVLVILCLKLLFLETHGLFDKENFPGEMNPYNPSKFFFLIFSTQEKIPLVNKYSSHSEVISFQDRNYLHIILSFGKYMNIMGLGPVPDESPVCITQWMK